MAGPVRSSSCTLEGSSLVSPSELECVHLPPNPSALLEPQRDRGREVDASVQPRDRGFIRRFEEGSEGARGEPAIVVSVIGERDGPEEVREHLRRCGRLYG